LILPLSRHIAFSLRPMESSDLALFADAVAIA
jgi:hypothetical protein